MKNFLDVYQNLNRDNVHILGTIYTDDIHFVDPAHEIHGLDNLKSYFESMYQNVHSIEFAYRQTDELKSEAYVQWDMTFAHKKLAGGRHITMSGITFLQFHSDGMIYFHRDYFDLGAMVYEHIPLLGRLVTSIKRSLGK
jgi:ketosteroid isomerase-like protein